jgi:hypothetical protein
MMPGPSVIVAVYNATPPVIRDEGYLLPYRVAPHASRRAPVPAVNEAP